MFTTTCPECSTENTLAARHLMVRVDTGVTTVGEMLFTCPSCHATPAVQLDAAGVAALAMGGVTHLSLSTPVFEHPETHCDGPLFTADDILDLHDELADDGRAATLVSPEG